MDEPVNIEQIFIRFKSHYFFYGQLYEDLTGMDLSLMPKEFILSIKVIVTSINIEISVSALLLLRSQSDHIFNHVPGRCVR